MLFSPFGKGHDPSFEKTWIPFTIARMFWAKFVCTYNWPNGSGGENFINFVTEFSLFRDYQSFWKGLYSNRLESPLPKYALLQVGWYWLKGSGEVNVKSWRVDGRTDDRRSLERTNGHLSLQLRWAKNSETFDICSSTKH